MRTHQSPRSGLDLVSEVSDLATGAGLLIFTLAPFALPALALTVLAGSLLLIPVVAGPLLAAPFLLARHWWRSRDRRSPATSAAQSRSPRPEPPPASSASENRYTTTSDLTSSASRGVRTVR